MAIGPGVFGGQIADDTLPLEKMLPAVQAEHNASYAHSLSTGTNPHIVTKADTGLGNVQNTLSNFGAILPPSATDDSGSGYSVGSLWVDTVAGKIWGCYDASLGAALWTELSFIGVGSLTVEEQDALPTVSNVTKIKFPNGTVTNEGLGVVSIATAVGAGTFEGYLGLPIFNLLSAGITTQTDAADPSTDFEQWHHVTSTQAGGRADAVFVGRLKSFETQIDEILIPVKGFGGIPQVRIAIYVEGGGSTNRYTGLYSSLQNFPGGRTLVTIPDSEISLQPAGEKRYIISVEYHLGIGGNGFAGTPFVRHE